MTPDIWRPLIEGMLEAVWLVDSVQLRVIAANSAAERLLDVPAGSLVGKPAVDMAYTPEDNFFWEDVAAGLSDSILSESMMQRSDGALLLVTRRVSRVRLGPQSGIYVVSVVDQTEQRRV